MGLAYNLDVSLWDNFGKYLPNGIIDFANTDPQALVLPPFADSFQGFDGIGGWENRWCGSGSIPNANTQYIFPTGEYILRDVAFNNGYMVFVGSYKAYFRDLFGSGSHGYAWDGFIMTIRNYSYDTLFTAPFKFNSATGAYTGLFNVFDSGWGFMPMRMPMDISPGVVGDAATIAADSSVGLMSLDIWKGGSDTEVGAPNSPDAGNVKIVAVGHQRVGDPVAQGMTFNDIDYVGFMWMTQILKTNAQITGLPSAEPFQFTAPQYFGTPATENNTNPTTYLDGTVINYIGERASTYQISWRATSNYSCFLPPPLGVANQTRLYDWDAWLSLGELQIAGSGIYSTEIWADGCKPNGTAWNGGAVCPSNTSAAFFNDYPRKLYDVTNFSQITRTTGGKTTVTQSPWVIGGDFSVGGDPTDPTDLLGTFPGVIGCALDSTLATVLADPTIPGDKVAYLGPFMISHVGGVSSRAASVGGTSSFLLNGSFTSGTPSLNGAYVAFSFVPYEIANQFTDGTPNPSNRTTAYQYAVNNITDGGGNKGCGIFFTNEQPQDEANLLQSILAPDMTSGAGAFLPDKWLSKLMQSRTFTVEEEARSKDQNYYGTTPPGGDPSLIYNANQKPEPEPVGVLSNYQRYGLDDDPEGNLGETQQMGNNSRQCYGLLGHKSGVGPVCYLFDSGRGWQKGPSYPVGNPNYAATKEWSNVAFDRGATFNGQFILNKNSVNRRAIWASWDNDRDQWLFLFSDPAFGIGSIAATSTLENTLPTIAFLGRTANFAWLAPTEPANY